MCLPLRDAQSIPSGEFLPCLPNLSFQGKPCHAHAIATVLPLHYIHHVVLLELEDESLVADLARQRGPVLYGPGIDQVRGLMVHVMARVVDDAEPRHRALVVTDLCSIRAMAWAVPWAGATG
eukprot:CAMPEP_0172715510 /NCGR_PEP_ID=MMETSP1074-20121228/67589_1 /TAXON_ID=2916 /ORGANISM="Ceratium fusus, Strain PA161109" /LENGTH=121 /DNA_ID=CAMNT_0013540095 /DNA_START=615 /DNA_END=977 /DNA_ORIENTATION=-